MKRILLAGLSLALIGLTFTSCGEDVDGRFVKKWTLVEVEGFGPEDDEILGVNNCYFDLRDDGTFNARWYDENSDTEFLDLEGTWTTMDFEGEIDLFLFYGNEDSKIFTVTSVGDGEMVMNLSEINHIFK